MIGLRRDRGDDLLGGLMQEDELADDPDFIKRVYDRTVPRGVQSEKIPKHKITPPRPQYV